MVTVTVNKRSPTFMPGGFDFLISFPVSGITNRAVSTVMYSSGVEKSDTNTM